MRQTKFNTGAIGPARRRWLRLDNLSLVLYRVHGSFLGLLPEGARQVERYEPLIDEHGDEVILSISNGRKRFSINLTSMTEAELKAFEDFIVSSVERARPVAIARDHIVQEVFDEFGHDSFMRLYRTLPVLYDRERLEREHAQGVQFRPQSVSSLDEPRDDSPLLSAKSRSGMAERDAESGGTSNNRETADVYEDILSLVEGEEEPPF